MQTLPRFVDMAKTPEEITEETKPYDQQDHPVPIYSYRQSISFDQEDLDKLDMDSNVEPGDMIYLQAIAKVTSVSKNETNEGCDCRIELQLTHISCEGEDAENNDASSRIGKMYNKG